MTEIVLAIRHFPDRKRPCLVLEEGNKAVIIGYLTDRKREHWLRRAFDVPPRIQWALKFHSTMDLDGIMGKGEKVDKKYER